MIRFIGSMAGIKKNIPPCYSYFSNERPNLPAEKQIHNLSIIRYL